MALNEAFGQTDVMNDPKYLMALMQRNPHDPMRQAAEARLAFLQHQQILSEQVAGRNAATNESQANRRDISEANRASREDIAHERNATRQDYQAGLSAEAQARQAGIDEAQKTRRASMLQLMASDPNLKPEEKAAVKSEMLKMAGVNVGGTAAATTGAKGAYGPGGAPVAPNAGGAPPTTQPVSASTYTPPTGAFTNGPIQRAQDATNSIARNSGPYISPQELNPQSGDPGMQERAAHLRNMVARGEANTGVTPISPLDDRITHGLSGVNRYDPDSKTNYATTGYGESVAVGGGDPSVGALAGSKTEILPNGQTKVTFPEGGYAIASSRIGKSGRSAAQDYVNNEDRNAGLPNSAQSPYTPPTASFTTGGSAAQPAAAPAPVSNTTTTSAPTNVGIGFPGASPLNLFSVGLDPNVPSNQKQDAAAAANRPPISFGPGSNQAQDAAAAPKTQQATVPVINPQAGNDRADLLRDTDNIFYGGGNVPAPTPTPTPVAKVAQQNPNAVHPLVANYYNKLLGLDNQNS